MTTFLLVRHGQSTGNLLNVCCGHQDYPLTALGERQAERAAAYLKEHYSIDHVYASPLLRASGTAEPTARAFGLPVHLEEGLIEICAGIWEAMDWGELREKFGDEHRRWIREGDYCPEGGEPIEAFCRRVCDCFEALAQRHSGECVALFCHSGVINRIYRSWIPKYPHIDQHLETYTFSNGSITAVELDGHGNPVSLPLFGYREHLKDIETTTPKDLV